MENLFTIICEFRGGTYTKQLRADSPQKVFRLWAKAFQEEGSLAQKDLKDFEEEVQNSLREKNIVSLESLQNVWYEAFSIGDDLLEVLIINTNEAEILAS
ncbi:MAG: hypothetical protein ACKVUS_08685 [Saprospiraceae bacterium]